MKNSELQARIDRLFADLDCLKTAARRGGWHDRLELYAEKGYPTGGDSLGGSNEINRPTERLALSPDTPPAQMLKDFEDAIKQLEPIVKRVSAIYHWTTKPAKYDGPEPRPCVILDCTHIITMIGNDKHRHGMCQACYMREYRKQKEGLPNLIDKRAS